jgi:hypothetical protein
MSAVLLDDVAAFVRRFVVVSDMQADAIALWVAHTHAAEAAETTPYLVLTSAEKRSGKTRLLEVLELVVHEPLPTANISDAALFRAIKELGPTLLLDEVDAIFGGKAREREDLRGLLNAGYRRGAVARRMGGAKMTTLEAFPVYCPKAFAAIGKLPDTIADRSIAIRLQPRPVMSRSSGSAAGGRSRGARACAMGSPIGSSRRSTTCANRGRRCPTSSTTGRRIVGSRCSRSPIWPVVTGLAAAIGRNGRGEQHSN